MNKVIRNLAVLTLSIGVLGACASTSEPLPPAAAEFPAPAPAAGVVAVDPAPAPAAAPAAAKPAAAAPAAAKGASSCDVVREALLSGTQTEINSAMTKLQADKTADADARETASDYLRQTDKDLRSMHVTLIRMQCS